jgi:hypothetical protein
MPPEDKKQDGEHRYDAHQHANDGITAVVGHNRGVTVRHACLLASLKRGRLQRRRERSLTEAEFFVSISA